MDKRPVVLTLGLLTGCLAAGYGVLFTMLDDYRDTYGIPEGQLGLIIGVGFFAGFFSQVLIAPYADRGHARHLVIVGILINLMGLTMMAVGTTFWALVLGRAIMGVGVGTAVPAVRRIVILSDPEHLGQNLGRLLALDVAGFAIGPLFSAVLVGPFGIPAPFVVVAVLTMAFLPLVLRIRVDETEVPAATSRFSIDLLRIRPFAGAVALGCAVFVMIGSFDALWAVALSDLDAADWMINVGITIFALPLIVLGPVGGRLSQRLGPFRVGSVGLMIGAACMMAYGLAPVPLLLLAVAVVHAIGDGLTVSSTGIAAGMSVPPQRQAGAQGMLGGFQTLAAGLAAGMAGVLYQSSGRATAYLASAGFMLVLVVLGVVLARPAWKMRGAPMTLDPAVGTEDRPISLETDTPVEETLATGGG